MCSAKFNKSISNDFIKHIDPGHVDNPDIAINGLGIAQEHCIIEHDKEHEEVVLTPRGGMVLVNGENVVGPVQLSHGMTVQLGDACVLRFNYTAQVSVL